MPTLLEQALRFARAERSQAREHRVRPPAVREQRDLDVLAHRHRRERRRHLERAPDAQPGDGLRRQSGQQASGQRRAAAVRRKLAVEHVEQGRLAGPIGSDHRDALPGRHIEAHAGRAPGRRRKPWQRRRSPAAARSRCRRLGGRGGVAAGPARRRAARRRCPAERAAPGPGWRRRASHASIRCDAPACPAARRAAPRRRPARAASAARPAAPSPARRPSAVSTAIPARCCPWKTRTAIRRVRQTGPPSTNPAQRTARTSIPIAAARRGESRAARSA